MLRRDTPYSSALRLRPLWWTPTVVLTTTALTITSVTVFWCSWKNPSLTKITARTSWQKFMAGDGVTHPEGFCTRGGCYKQSMYNKIAIEVQISTFTQDVELWDWKLWFLREAKLPFFCHDSGEIERIIREIRLFSYVVSYARAFDICSQKWGLIYTKGYTRGITV